MDTNNFFSFSRIAMVMKREIMENWKTNLYRLIGIYAAFALVMILHMWTMSSGRSSQISFTTYCSNIMGTFVFIIGIASIAYAANIMENMITKEKRIAFLMLPATMIEKFVARFLIVTVGMAAAIDVVEYFDRSRHWTQEVECSPASKHLDIALMWRKQGDQLVG
jgi:hypothetical protein